jgi:sucrose phosphorylase
VERPYELNISLFDAMKGTFDGPDDYQFQRFICAHAIMLALEGIPAFYIHSLLATQNDHDKVKATGSKRAINRHDWQRSELCVQLDDADNIHAKVFDELARLITIRKRQRAFHPNATQFTMHFATHLFAFWRQSMDRAQSIFCIYNVTDKQCSFALQDVNLVETQEWHDLVTGERYTDFRQEIVLEPYQFVWITNM